MDTLDAYQALLAAQTEKAVPRTRHRHTHLVERPFAVVGYHLAGDAGAPLAFMFGDSPDPASATVIAIPEPRNRADRFDALAQFGASLNEYLDTSGNNEEDGPQLMLANPATAHWLLGLVARWTRNLQTEGEFAVAEAVPTAGQNMSALRDIMITPGSSMVYIATDVLTLHYKTGQLPAEDLNMGALLGWVDPLDGLSGPQAARRGEQQPPAGPLTDPNWDADYLEGFSKQWRTTSRDSRDSYKMLHEQRLREQLLPAWNDLWRSREIMQRMDPTADAANRYQHDLDAWGSHVQRMDAEGGARFRTIPRPTSAAFTLSRHEDRQQTLEAQMAQSDPLVLARYASKGQLLDGTVTATNLTARDGRKLRPRLTVSPALACDLGPGDELRLLALPDIRLEVVGFIRSDPFEPIEVMVVGGANQPARLTRLPNIGDRLIASGLTEAGFYRVERLAEVPWTHELEAS